MRTLLLLGMIVVMQSALAVTITFSVDCQGTVSGSGANQTCAASSTPPPNPNPEPPVGLENCSNQGIYVLGNAAIPMTWQGSSTFFSTSYGNFGDSTAWLFSMAVPGGASSTTYNRIVVSEYGGNAYSRTIAVSLLPCDMRTTVDVTGVNGPVLAAGGSTASVFYGASSGTPTYPYVMVPGKTYYITITNHLWGDGWSCGKSNCQAITNLQ